MITPRRRGRRFAALALLAATTLAAACSGDPEPALDRGAERGAAITWTKVDLAAGDEPAVLAKQNDDLLIGVRRRTAKVVPGLLVLSGGKQREIPLRPNSPYAYYAIWYSIATDGTRILALGGARGGAHSNPRWTVWSGSAAGLVEHPQEFNTFGGQTAGELFSAVLTPTGPALLGSWGGSDKSGLDAAVWLAKGNKWFRQNSAGTALQSKPELLVGPSFGTMSGPGIVLVGSQVRLGPNVVEQGAALWRSTALNQGWSRLALPEPGKRSNAVTVGCVTDTCVVSGQADGKLAMWEVKGDQATRYGGLPPVAVGDKDRLPPPVVANDKVVQVAADAGQVKVITGRGSSWKVHDSTGPAGAVTDAVVVGDSLYVVAGPPDGPTALWRTDLSALG